VAHAGVIIGNWTFFNWIF